MEILEISGKSAVIEKACEVLSAGGVVMHPTETCYGLAVDVFNDRALQKLYELKRMSEDKPVSIMVASVEEARDFVEFSDLAERIAEKFWPGPLTLVLPRKKTLPDFFNPGIETVGVRVPYNEFCLELLKQYGKPLSTTSANISGEKEVYRVEDYLKQVEGSELKPDLIIDGGELPKKKPSTVLEILNEDVKFLREGELAEEIKKLVGLL